MTFYRAIFSTVLTIWILAFSSYPATAQTANPDNTAAEEASIIIRIDDLVPEKARWLVEQNLDLWDLSGDSAVLYVNDSQKRRLEEEGFVLTVLETRHHDQKGLTPDPEWFDFETYVSEMNRWVSEYPELASMQSLGQSIEGRDIWMVTITSDVTVDENKPEVFLISLQHAREWLAGMTLYGVADRFLSGYGIDPVVTDLLDTMELHVVLVANPDGYIYSHTTNRLWRKNRRDNGDDSFGVDLNRDFPFQFRLINNSSAYNFGGTEPLSEPETVAVHTFLTAPERNLVGLLNYHTFGNLVLSSWSYTTDAPPNYYSVGEVSYGLAKAIEGVHGQRMRNGPGSVLISYTSGGAMGDFSQALLGLPAFTLELRSGGGTASGFEPEPSVILPSQEENFVGAIEYLRTVRALYSDNTPPVIQNLGVLDVSNDTFTVTWETNELADRTLEFGINTFDENSLQPDRMPSDRHSVTVTGAVPGETYSLRASSTNIAGLRTASDVLTITLPTTPQDIEPPAAPAIRFIRNYDGTLTRIGWTDLSDGEAIGMRLYESPDRLRWNLVVDESDLTSVRTVFNFPSPPKDRLHFYKLVSVDAAGNESIASDIYAHQVSDTPTSTIVVDGYDDWRLKAEANVTLNHDFAADHGAALSWFDVPFDTVANQSAGTTVNLSTYDKIFWVLGDEGFSGVAISASEQAIMMEFLERGGNLFVSGSNIANNLDPEGNPEDRVFLAGYLAADFKTNDVNEYEATGPNAESIFFGIDIPWDSGHERIYRVSSPDGIVNTAGSSVALRTPEGKTVGVQREGFFGTSTTPGRVVYLTFPFETVFPEAKRREVMGAVLEFFDVETQEADYREVWVLF